jgi:hypothetical protein
MGEKFPDVYARALEAPAAIELILLEAAWNDDIACEARHLDTHPPCTGEVTHMIRNCWPTPGATKRVCQAIGDWTADSLTRGGNCNTCGELKRDHWDVWPI